MTAGARPYRRPSGSVSTVNLHCYSDGASSSTGKRQSSCGQTSGSRAGRSVRRRQPISAGAIDRCGCAIGCQGMSPSALLERADLIRLVGSTFSQRHAPHSRRPRQPAGGPGGPLGRPAAADPDGAQAGSATDPPPPTAAALKASLSGSCPPPPPSPCRGHSGRHCRRWAPPSSACRS